MSYIHTSWTLLETINEIHGLGIFEFHASTNTVKISQGWKQIFELDEAQEISIQEALSYYDEPYRTQLLSFGKEMMSLSASEISLSTLQQECSITTAKGHKKWVRVYRTRHIENDRAISRGFVQDITAEIAERELALQYQDLYNNAPCGYCTVDEDGFIVRCNKTLAEYLEYSRSEIEGKKRMPEIIAPSSRILREKLKQKALKEGGHNNSEVEFVRKDGSTFWGMVSAKLISNEVTGKKIANITVLDLTERKELELVRHHQELAEESNRIKSEFLNILAHEFRTPLGIMVAASENLEELVPAEGKEILELLNHGAARMSKLLSNIIELAKIEFDSEGEIVKKLTITREIADMLYADWKPKIESKGLEFHLLYDNDIPTSLHLDYLQVTKICSKILDNALKATTEGRIILSFMLMRDEIMLIPYLLICIEDTGSGISSEKMKYLFKPFYQAERSHFESQEAAGIGLTIAKHLLRKMKGSIRAESTLGVGTKVWCRIPLEEGDVHRIIPPRQSVQ